MVNKKTILDAYLFLRENNHTIPDETLDFMKDASLREMDIIDSRRLKEKTYFDKMYEKLIAMRYDEPLINNILHLELLTNIDIAVTIAIQSINHIKDLRTLLTKYMHVCPEVLDIK